MTAKRLDALLAIGALLAPKAKRLAAKVRLAVEDPDAFIAANAERMNDRGIEEPIPDLPWIALIDELAAAKALSSIDWKTDAETVAWAIGKIRGAPRGASAWMKTDGELAERATWELLELSGRHVLTKQVQLANLDIGADNYNLVLVPAASAAELVRLAKTARYGSAELITGKDLAAATKDRIARNAKHARQQAREAKRPEPVWDAYARGDETYFIKKARRAFDASYHTPTMKRFESHYFSSPATAIAGHRAFVAALRKAGYQKLSKAAGDARTYFEGDSIGEFPETATYFRQRTKYIRCVELRDTAVVSMGGMIGRAFGELVGFQYHRTAKAAQRDFDERIANLESDGRRTKRSTVLAAYGLSE